MKISLPKILLPLLVTGFFSCNQFVDSIKETLNGSATDSSAAENNEYTGHTSSSSTVSIVTHSSTTTTSAGTTHTTETETHVIQDGFLGNAAGLNAAEKALRALPIFAGKSIHLYNIIHCYNDGRISVQVQHPENPAYVDEYNFSDGKWQPPKPVQLSVRDDIKTKLISLDEFKFTSIAAVFRNYKLKAAEIDGAPDLTTIYASFRNNSITWYPRDISGSRERYAISFKEDGSIDKFYRE